MDYDKARRQERVPRNPYGGVDYTTGLEYFIGLGEIEPLLALLAEQGDDIVRRRVQAVCSQHLRDGILPAELVYRALHDLPTTTLQGIAATAFHGFGKADHRYFRTLARRALVSRAEDCGTATPSTSDAPESAAKRIDAHPRVKSDEPVEPRSSGQQVARTSEGEAPTVPAKPAARRSDVEQGKSLVIRRSEGVAPRRKHGAVGERGPAAPTPSTIRPVESRQSDVTEQIRQLQALAELKAAGILTLDELSELKLRVLSPDLVTPVSLPMSSAISSSEMHDAHGAVTSATYNRVCPSCGHSKNRMRSNRCVRCRREFEGT